MKDDLSANLSPPITQLNHRVGRIFSLDLLKAISIAAVVFYHSIFVPLSTYADVAILELIISAPLRFCVPVLFTISFMLFERELSKHNAKSDFSLLRKRLYRLAIPTVFWFSLAAALQLLKGNEPAELIGDGLTGTIYIGAFYLVIMLQFTPVFFVLRSWFRNCNNIMLTIFIQGVIFILIQALLAKNFGTSGIYIINILRSINRSLFAYWFVYMALGYYCYHKWSAFEKISSQMTTQLKIIVIGTTSLVMTVEYSRLITGLEGDNSTFEYAMLSCIISVFVAFACFASVEENRLPPFCRQAVLLLSKYSLGIFCINGILSQAFSLLGSRIFSEATFNLPEIMAVRLVGWGVLLAVSLCLSVLLNRVGLGACVR